MSLYDVSTASLPLVQKTRVVDLCFMALANTIRWILVSRVSVVLPESSVWIRLWRASTLFVT